MERQTISAIIIDDEREAIKLLEMYLRQYPLIRVTGKETNAKKGLEMVLETMPEIVFLDVDMPDMDGLKLAGKIHSEGFNSEIVFTTAHQHYAYEALDLEPLDFLTKPFCAEDLEIVIRKYNAKAEKKQFELKLNKFLHSQITNSSKIKIPTITGMLIADLKDIVFLHSVANNCKVYLQDGTVETSTRSISTLIELMNSSVFFRTGRSTCINLNYLQRVDKKRHICIVGFKHTVYEVSLNKNSIAYFEKLDLIPLL